MTTRGSTKADHADAAEANTAATTDGFKVNLVSNSADPQQQGGGRNTGTAAGNAAGDGKVQAVEGDGQQQQGKPKGGDGQQQQGKGGDDDQQQQPQKGGGRNVKGTDSEAQDQGPTQQGQKAQ